MIHHVTQSSQRMKNTEKKIENRRERSLLSCVCAPNFVFFFEFFTCVSMDLKIHTKTQNVPLSCFIMSHNHLNV